MPEERLTFTTSAERDAAEVRLRELEAKATPGPWEVDAGVNVLGPSGRTVTSGERDVREASAELIAALHNYSLPIINALRAELAAVRKALDSNVKT